MGILKLIYKYYDINNNNNLKFYSCELKKNCILVG